MRLQHFGDSYDIVKRSLLYWLQPFGPWAAHPMFTEPFDEHDAAAFSRFLGVPLISTEVLSPSTDRLNYFDMDSAVRSLFLDPDTGVRLSASQAPHRHQYLFASELIALSLQRPDGLFLVFDQSFPRGREESTMQEKFRYLAERDVYAFAYTSHASFIIAGTTKTLVGDARKTILAASSLPSHRLVSLTA